MLKLLFTILLMLAPSFCLANTLDYVVDGDTIVLRTGEKIRLYGVDCAEMDSRKGREAKQYLQKILKKGSRVDILRKGIDTYDRTLAIVIYNLESINYKLIDEKVCNKYRRPRRK